MSETTQRHRLQHGRPLFVGVRLVGDGVGDGTRDVCVVVDELVVDLGVVVGHDRKALLRVPASVLKTLTEGIRFLVLELTCIGRVDAGPQRYLGIPRRFALRLRKTRPILYRMLLRLILAALALSQLPYRYLLLPIHLRDKLIPWNLYFNLLQIDDALLVRFEPLIDCLGSDSLLWICLKHFCDEIGKLLRVPILKYVQEALYFCLSIAIV
jgi:hypothetical protein